MSDGVKKWEEAEALYRQTERSLEEVRTTFKEQREALEDMQKTDPTTFRSFVTAIGKMENELSTNRMFGMFPTDDYWQWNEGFQQYLNLKRDNYIKHISFLNSTKDSQYAAFFAGNRVGKTQLGAFMTACHLTGLYPPWWKGHKFNAPIEAWCVVENYEVTKDPVQKMLFGRFFPGVDKTVSGTGTVPKSKVDVKSLTGRGGATPDVLMSVRVRHVASSGRENFSQLHFKSFEQSVQSFGGRGVDWIWIDEGPPTEIFQECCMRVVSTGGRLIITWTPLQGYTPVVQQFIPSETSFSNVFDSNEPTVKVTEKSSLTMAGWDDIPHIPKKERDDSIAHMRKTGQSEDMINARVKGIPHIGEGKIYNLPHEDVLYDPVRKGEFPKHFRRVFGLDVGWRVTAAIWAAYDPENDVIYLYNEHYGQNKDMVHNAGAIKARGDWIPGVIDPASQQRQQLDGKRLLDEYRNQGLILQPADNAVEAGIEKVKERLYTGRLKISSALEYFWKEYDLYRRVLSEDDDTAKILRADNHLMDAMRYLVMSGLKVAKTKTDQKIRKRVGGFRQFATWE